MATIVRFQMDVHMPSDIQAGRLLDTQTPGNVDEQIDLEYTVGESIRAYMEMLHGVCPELTVTLTYQNVGTEREVPLSSLEPGPGTEDTNVICEDLAWA